MRVDRGSAFPDILLEYDVSAHGHVVVGIISSQGISGEGTIATIILQTKKGGTDRSVAVENILAYGGEDLAELPFNTSTMESKGKAPAAPVIEFLPTAE